MPSFYRWLPVPSPVFRRPQDSQWVCRWQPSSVTKRTDMMLRQRRCWDAASQSCWTTIFDDCPHSVLDNYKRPSVWRGTWLVWILSALLNQPCFLHACATHKKNLTKYILFSFATEDSAGIRVEGPPPWQQLLWTSSHCPLKEFLTTHEHVCDSWLVTLCGEGEEAT